MTTKETIAVQPYDRVVTLLNGVRQAMPRRGQSRAARAYCPACHPEHAGRQHDRTLAVAESTDGAVLLFCHRCGGATPALAALELSLSELYPAHMRWHKGPDGSPSHWTALYAALEAAESAAARLMATSGCHCHEHTRAQCRALELYWDATEALRRAARATAQELAAERRQQEGRS